MIMIMIMFSSKSRGGNVYWRSCDSLEMPCPFSRDQVDTSFPV